MTRLNIDLRQDVPGGTESRGGALTARRTSVRVDGAVIVYPTELTFPLPGPVILDEPPAGEAWKIRLTAVGTDPIYRTVTFSGSDTTWADLTDVDPATLTPATAPPRKQWLAVVALSQHDYDALLSPDASTLYLITA